MLCEKKNDILLIQAKQMASTCSKFIIKPFEFRANSDLANEVAHADKFNYHVSAYRLLTAPEAAALLFLLSFLAGALHIIIIISIITTRVSKR